MVEDQQSIGELYHSIVIRIGSVSTLKLELTSEQVKHQRECVHQAHLPITVQVASPKEHKRFVICWTSTVHK